MTCVSNNKVIIFNDGWDDMRHRCAVNLLQYYYAVFAINGRVTLFDRLFVV